MMNTVFALLALTIFARSVWGAAAIFLLVVFILDVFFDETVEGAA